MASLFALLERSKGLVGCVNVKLCISAGQGRPASSCNSCNIKKVKKNKSISGVETTRVIKKVGGLR